MERWRVEEPAEANLTYWFDILDRACGNAALHKCGVLIVHTALDVIITSTTRVSYGTIREEQEVWPSPVIATTPA